MNESCAFLLRWLMPLTAQDSRRRKWRGKHWEIHLVKLLERRGWKAKRSSVSGLGRNDPDVMAVKPHRLAVFESKSSRTGVAKINRRQIEKLHQALEYYAFLDEDNRLEALLAVKFPYKRWIFTKLKPSELEENARTIKERLEGFCAVFGT